MIEFSIENLVELLGFRTTSYDKYDFSLDSQNIEDKEDYLRFDRG